MATRVKELTEKRKDNLRKTGKGKNSMEEPGEKPSGPMASEMGNEVWDSGLIATMGDDIQQWGALVVGVGMCSYGVYGLTSNSKASKALNIALTAVGAGLTYYAINGLTSSEDSMGEEDVDGLENPAAPIAHGSGIKVTESILVDASPEELYEYWRNFENLPFIMSHLESVEEEDDTFSHWKAKAPMGMSVEWDAEVYVDRPGEIISWRSTEDSEVDNAGSVRFEPAGEGTRVSVMLKYDPPAGKLGAAIAKLFGEEPSQQIKEDLRRFRDYVEGIEGSSGSTNHQPGQSYGDLDDSSNGGGNLL